MNSSKQNDSKSLPVALVLGTGQCALGTIRSLKEDPHIRIIVTGNERKGVAQFSGYIEKYYPCKEDDINDVYGILKIINEQYDNIVIIPTGSDFWVDIMINSPYDFNHFITDIRPQYANLMQKDFQRSLAVTCNIPYPDSHKITKPEDFDDLQDHIGFPCVVKPVSRTSKQVPFRIRSYKTQKGLIKDIKPFLGQYEFLVSTKIEGPDKNIYTYGSFAVDGKIQNEYFGRKLTQRPMKYGVAGIAESCRVIPEIRAYSEKMLNETTFSGISQIEFKKDTKTGKYYLMEINPRIWLWIQTATISGVNLVLAYYYHLAKMNAVVFKQKQKAMFISGLSLFDNTVREKNITWMLYYIKSRFVNHIYSIKDKNDPEPYRVERKRFIKKITQKFRKNL